jgi:hypothetical protein
VLGLGKTVDGDYLSSDDLELLFTIAGYVAIAIENARLYQSLEQKAMQIERLKDFSENIVESLNIGVLTVDLERTASSPGIRSSKSCSRSARRGAGPEAWRTCFQPDLVAEIARARRQRPRFRNLQVPMKRPQRPPPGDQRFDRAASGKGRRPSRPADPARRHHAARAHGRPNAAERKAHVARDCSRRA